MVYGLWFMVSGLVFMVYGLWFMVSLVYGLWCMVYSFMVDGLCFRVQVQGLDFSVQCSVLRV